MENGRASALPAEILGLWIFAAVGTNHAAPT